MRMKQRFILLIMSVALFAPHLVSAQEAPPRAHFIYSPSLFDDRDFVYNVMFGSTHAPLEPDIMTKYYAMQSGTQTIEFTYPDENDSAEGSTSSTEIVLEAGNHYAVIGIGPDQPPIVVNETAAEAESDLAEGGNVLTIVTSVATGSGTATNAFKVVDNTSPTPQERVVFEYSGYLQSGIGTNGVVVQHFDPQTQAIIASINIPYFPDTHIIINGDRLVDLITPVVINYSTSLSTADWLAGINQMENPPFTFNQFINSAVAGGFDAALVECEDYMWMVWTDAAFANQSSSNQTFISGAGAGDILNNSVLEGATTTPWFISPTATRGGTPLFFGDPLAELDSATLTEGAVAGNILMTLSTSGNNVQNVIHITDTVPIGEAIETPVRDVMLFPSRTRHNLALPFGSSE
jgi:hypothetical protein